MGHAEVCAQESYEPTVCRTRCLKNERRAVLAHKYSDAQRLIDGWRWVTGGRNIALGDEVSRETRVGFT